MTDDEEALSKKIKEKIDDNIIKSTVSTIKSIKKLTEKKSSDREDELDVTENH